jgi:ABC-2 type transport system ATP-binding protein
VLTASASFDCRRTMGAIVAVRNLRKRYGRIQALRGVSFDVEEGTIFGLLGPNGAGKTTTVECLLGLRDADEGSVELCGLDARTQPAAVRQRLGAALQTTALQDKVTPREALALFGSFYEKHRSPDSLLTRFALQEKADAPFDSLSGGQRQRLALALAFVNQPQVVILDEPTTGLDPEARHELQGEILRMKEDGHTVLLTTHQLEEAERLCDVVAIIDHGAVIACDTPRRLIAGRGAAHTVTIDAAQPLAPSDWLNLPDALEAVVEGTRVRFQTRSPEATVTAALALLARTHNPLAHLQVTRGSLEDVFLQLTRNEAQAQ